MGLHGASEEGVGQGLLPVDSLRVLLPTTPGQTRVALGASISYQQDYQLTTRSNSCSASSRDYTYIQFTPANTGPPSKHQQIPNSLTPIIPNSTKEFVTGRGKTSQTKRENRFHSIHNKKRLATQRKLLFFSLYRSKALWLNETLILQSFQYLLKSSDVATQKLFLYESVVSSKI